ncbi:hypothetical protein KKG41_04975 [Patescibacteria group bacterium]|nr:hypothetical protein [Patescibacteria group bacterium]MBU1890525.1 hypothetical protein [Patescibacteria group bacterium]
MTDINLIQDSAGEDEKKKKKESGEIKYTDPPKETDEEEKPQKPKGSFLEKFFRRKEKKAEQPPTIIKEQPPVKKPAEKPVIEPISHIGSAPKEPGQSFGPTKMSLQSRETKKQSSRVLEEKIKKKTDKKAKKSDPDTIDPVEDQSFLDVNLMPGDIIDNLEPKGKIITYAIVAVVSFLFVAGVYIALAYYEENIYQGTEDVAKEIQEVEDAIDGLRDTQQAALLFKSQADQVKDIFDKHIHWSNFFEMLERYTLSEVAYSSFTGSLTRGSNPQFSLSATGKDFRSISRQIMAFRDEAKDFIVDVKANSGSRTDGGEEGDDSVSFSIGITVFEDIFYDSLEEKEEQ